MVLEQSKLMVKFINEFKSQENVNFYLEHLSLEELDNRYKDDEFFYFGEEPDSETDPEYIARKVSMLRMEVLMEYLLMTMTMMKNLTGQLCCLTS